MNPYETPRNEVPTRGTVLGRFKLVCLSLICICIIAYVAWRPLFGRESYIPPREWLEKKQGTPATVDWNGKTYPRSGDEVWSFSSPRSYWQQLMGTGGICLLRDGEIIDGYVTHVN